jgi:geranylgeranyl pyrophosphate synthase
MAKGKKIMLTALKIGDRNVEQFVQRVQQIMNESVRVDSVDHPDGRVDEVELVTKQMLSSTGKGIRPLLVAMTGTMLDCDLDRLLEAAAAVEMIHLASLVHDDIIDGSDLRRGKPALRSIWGDAVAVLAGDWLYARAFELLATIEIPKALSLLTHTVGLMCQGEIEQRLNYYNYSITEAEYFEVIKKKTGALLACACHLGVLLARAPEDIQSALSLFGERLGIAYQITDDLLDWTVDHNVSGKPRGADLSQGLITLPLIYLLRTPFKDEVIEILSILQNENRKPKEEEFTLLLQAMEYYGCLDEARKEAKAWVKSAVDIIGGLPEEKTEGLIQMAKTAIFRSV